MEGEHPAIPQVVAELRAERSPSPVEILACHLRRNEVEWCEQFKMQLQLPVSENQSINKSIKQSITQSISGHCQAEKFGLRYDHGVIMMASQRLGVIMMASQRLGVIMMASQRLGMIMMASQRLGVIMMAS